MAHIQSSHDFLIMRTTNPAQIQIPDFLLVVHNSHAVQTVRGLIAKRMFAID